MDNMPVVLFGALHDPFSRYEVIRRLALAGAFEFKMMGFEDLFITVEGLVLERTHDLVGPDLVDLIDPAFEHAEHEQHDEDHSSGNGGNQEVSAADAHSESGCHPDHRRGSDAVDLAVSFEDDACSDETDARDDIGGDTVGVAGRADPLRKDGEKGCAETDEGHRPEARRFAAVFSFRADGAADNDGQYQFQKDILHDDKY